MRVLLILTALLAVSAVCHGGKRKQKRRGGRGGRKGRWQHLLLGAGDGTWTGFADAEEAVEAQGRMLCTTDDDLDGVCRQSGNCPPARLQLTSIETVCPGGRRRPKICCPFRQQDAGVAPRAGRRMLCTTDDGLDGVCRQSGNCPPARLQLTSIETVCPGGRRRPKICCPFRQQAGNAPGPAPVTEGPEVTTKSPVVSTGGGGFNTGGGTTGGLSTGVSPVGSQQGGRLNQEIWQPWESTAAPGGGGGFSWPGSGSFGGFGGESPSTGFPAGSSRPVSGGGLFVGVGPSDSSSGTIPSGGVFGSESNRGSFNMGSTRPEMPSRGSFGAESSGGSFPGESSGLGSSGTSPAGSPSSGGFVDEPSRTSPTDSTPSGGGFASSGTGSPGGGFASGGTSDGDSSASGSSGGRFSGGGFASSVPSDGGFANSGASDGGSPTSGSSGGRFSGGGFASSGPSDGGLSSSGSSGGRFSGGGFASSGSSDGDVSGGGSSGGGSSGGGFSGGGSPNVDKESSSGTTLSGGGGSNGGGFSSGGGFASGSLPVGGGAVGSGSSSGEGSFGGGQNDNETVFQRIDVSLETTSVAPPLPPAECGLPTPKLVWLRTGRASQQSSTPAPPPGLFDIRVIGGKNAEIGKWPWIALIGHKQGDKPPFWFCGGTLIDNQNILTAAHCLKPRAVNPATLVVRLGEYDTSSADDGANPQDYGVTAFTNHKDFKFPVLHDDISLVHLDKPVVYTEAIKPICLPPGPSGDYAGSRIDVAGWGYTEFGGESSSILQEVDLPVVAVQDCQAVYATSSSFKNQFPNGFGDNKLCAGEEEGGKDACQGDSGGPMVRRMDDGRFELMGVVSAGVGCGKPGFPGVYTRVSAYLAWIQQNKK